MRLTAWEEERLLVFTAAELARRHRDRGLLVRFVVRAMCPGLMGMRSIDRAGSPENASRGAVRPR